MHLRAGMPDPPLTLRGQMEARIARKVAALTGISGRPDATADTGHGYSWCSDYRSWLSEHRISRTHGRNQVRETSGGASSPPVPSFPSERPRDDE